MLSVVRLNVVILSVVAPEPNIVDECKIAKHSSLLRDGASRIIK